MRVLSAEEAEESSIRHVLSRSLGMNLFVNVEINEVQLLPGDVLLLCSDGVHGGITAADMAEIIGRHRDLNKAAQQLVAASNEQDGSDNLSVQLIRIRSIERVGMYRGRPYKLR
jgi:protein phosphatase